MFCPEDGAEIPMSHSDAVFAFYPPCDDCGTIWRYNGESGVYEQDDGYEDTLADFADDDARKEI